MKALQTRWRRPADFESDRAGEVQSLRRTLRDVVAMSALPSIWVDCDLPGSLQNLTDVLRAALRSVTVCVRVELPGGSMFSTAASDGLRNSSAPRWDAGELLDAIEPDATGLVEIPRFNGSGPLKVLPHPLYFDGCRIGCLAACYKSDARPSQNDLLLLQVAANQIALLFQRHKDQEERLARKLAEQAARTSESRIQSLLTLMPAAVYACDAEGRIIFYNRRAVELWGCEPKLNDSQQTFCAAYKCWFGDKVLRPEETPMAVAVREGKAFRNLEPVFERPDGKKFPVLVNIDPLLDADGKPAGAINVFQDVTPLKRAQQDLKSREEHLRAVVENTPECVKLVAEDGTLLAMNGAGLCMVEADSAEEAIGKNIYDVIAPEFRGAFRAMNERVCAGNKERLEFEIIGLKGTRRWMETHAAPIVDPASGRTVQIAVTRNVTERRNTELELRRKNKQLAAFLETAALGLHRVGPDGIIQWANDAELQMLGYSREEYIGHHIAEFHADQPVIQDILKRLTCGEKLYGCEARLKCKDGSIKDVLIDSSVLWEDGKFVHTQCFTRDVTEHKNAERALRESEAQLQTELADSKLLQAISAEIVSESSIDALYEKLVEAAAKMMRSDFASMQMYYPERGDGELRLLALRGFGPEAARTWEWVSRESPSSCGEALRRGKRVIGTDVEQCAFLGTDGLAAYRAAGIGSMQSTPLFSRSGELVGMLSTHWRKPHQSTERELRLFDILARLAADVIERRRTEMILRESNALLEGQKDAFQAAMKGRSLEESLEVLVRKAIEFTGGQGRAAFYITSPDGLALHHVVGMPEHYAKAVDGFPVSGESMACGLAVHTGRAVITRDVEEDSSWDTFRWLARHHNFRACWSFPVHTSESPALGTLAMYFKEPRQPTPREMELVSVIAHAATVIISRHQQTVKREGAEQALRETNERLQKVLEIETVGVMFWDLTTGCLIDANNTFLDMMGYSRADVESRSLTWEKFTPPEYHEISRAEIAKFMASGRVGPYEKEYFHKNGTRRWLLFAGSSLGNNQCVEFCVDVSEQKKAEQALRESEERYRATFENAAVGIAHVGLDGRWLRINDPVCAITGYAREELERMTFADITHPDDIERDWQNARQLIAGKIPRYAIEKRYIRKDGSPVWVMLTVSLMRDAAGQPLHFVSVIENIDEKKRAREILEQTVNERTASLREAIEQMEEFSYSVSHDLRGPLRAMNAYAGVLLEEYGNRLDATACGYLQKIQRSSDRMNRLTQDVLAYSRVARSQAQPENIDLDRLVRDVIHQHAILQPPAARIEIVSPLPAVLGHETTLGQSVSNLLHNAVKFVAPGVTPQVRVRAETKARTVRLWFEDNGIGLKPEHQQRIFNMFERVHPEGMYEGTGIGLTIVRKAVEKMGGKVGVESDGQNGSRFWIELPCAE